MDRLLLCPELSKAIFSDTFNYTFDWSLVLRQLPMQISKDPGSNTAWNGPLKMSDSITINEL